MTKSLVIAVNDGYGGYGDFIFALKSAQELRAYYAAHGTDTPIYLVTQNSGKDKIQILKGAQEFGVEVLTPTELQERVLTSDGSRKIEIGAVIEVPSFPGSISPAAKEVENPHLSILEQIDVALASSPTPVPLTLVTEYGGLTVRSRSLFSETLKRQHHRKLKRKEFGNMRYQRTVTPGFDQAFNDRGIIFNPSLSSPAGTNWVSMLDEKIRNTILKTEPRAELSFQYSHDEETSPSAAEHFLKIHAEFYKDSSKNQDVLMVGKQLSSKKKALSAVKDRLITAGFELITFYNADTGKEEVLHGNKERGGKTYRVIYTQGMSHPSMMACTALSGPLMGATGDQSFGEALSAKKIIVYEEFFHKKGFIDSYDRSLMASSRDNLKETIHLLRTARTDEEYLRLGELLKLPRIQDEIRQANEELLEQNYLAPLLANIAFKTKTETLEKLKDLLKEGKQEEALELFNNPRNETINLFDEVDGKTLLSCAEENNPEGVFVKYFKDESSRWLMQLLEGRQEDQALDFIKQNGMRLDTEIFGHKLSTLITYFESKKIMNHLIRHELSILIQADDNGKSAKYFFNKYSGDSNTHGLYDPISFFDAIDGKTFSQQAINANAVIFLERYIHGYNIRLLQFMHHDQAKAIEEMHKRNMNFKSKIYVRTQGLSLTADPPDPESISLINLALRDNNEAFIDALAADLFLPCEYSDFIQVLEHHGWNSYLSRHPILREREKETLERTKERILSLPDNFESLMHFLNVLMRSYFLQDTEREFSKAIADSIIKRISSLKLTPDQFHKIVYRMIDPQLSPKGPLSRAQIPSSDLSKQLLKKMEKNSELRPTNFTQLENLLLVLNSNEKLKILSLVKDQLSTLITTKDELFSFMEKFGIKIDPFRRDFSYIKCVIALSDFCISTKETRPTFPSLEIQRLTSQKLGFSILDDTLGQGQPSTYSSNIFRVTPALNEMAKYKSTPIFGVLLYDLVKTYIEKRSNQLDESWVSKIFSRYSKKEKLKSAQKLAEIIKTNQTLTRAELRDFPGLSNGRLAKLYGAYRAWKATPASKLEEGGKCLNSALRAPIGTRYPNVMGFLRPGTNRQTHRDLSDNPSNASEQKSDFKRQP